MATEKSELKPNIYKIITSEMLFVLMTHTAIKLSPIDQIMLIYFNFYHFK